MPGFLFILLLSTTTACYFRCFFALRLLPRTLYRWTFTSRAALRRHTVPVYAISTRRVATFLGFIATFFVCNRFSIFPTCYHETNSRVNVSTLRGSPLRIATLIPAICHVVTRAVWISRSPADHTTYTSCVALFLPGFRNIVPPARPQLRQTLLTRFGFHITWTTASTACLWFFRFIPAFISSGHADSRRAYLPRCTVSAVTFNPGSLLVAFAERYLDVVARFITGTRDEPALRVPYALLQPPRASIWRDSRLHLFLRYAAYYDYPQTFWLPRETHGCRWRLLACLHNPFPAVPTYALLPVAPGAFSPDDVAGSNEFVDVVRDSMQRFTHHEHVISYRGYRLAAIPDNRLSPAYLLRCSTYLCGSLGVTWAAVWFVLCGSTGTRIFLPLQHRTSDAQTPRSCRFYATRSPPRATSPTTSANRRAAHTRHLRPPFAHLLTGLPHLPLPDLMRAPPPPHHLLVRVLPVHVAAHWTAARVRRICLSAGRAELAGKP